MLKGFGEIQEQAINYVTVATMPIIVVMGVSGCGKCVMNSSCFPLSLPRSTTGLLLGSRLNWVFEDADGLHSPEAIAKMRSGTPLDDDDRNPWLQRVNALLKRFDSSEFLVILIQSSWVARKTSGVIACSALKKAYRLLIVAGLQTEVTFAYLRVSSCGSSFQPHSPFPQLNKETLIDRMRRRPDHFMPASLLESQLATLEEPDPLVESVMIVDADGRCPGLNHAARRHEAQVLAEEIVEAIVAGGAVWKTLPTPRVEALTTCTLVPLLRTWA
jgi:carbohydrate kinase (thermoresistant glucokinase family)